MTSPTVNELRRRQIINRSEIDAWVWRSDLYLRRGRPMLALECQLAALWLLGFES